MAGTCFYLPRDQGVQHPAGGRGVRYYGTSYRIPASQQNTMHQLEWEVSPDELLAPIAEAAAREGRWEPEPGGVVERFDTMDRETGELIVTYRIPFREAGADEAMEGA